MPDFSQSAPGLGPPAVIDHVLLPVGNLEDAARHLHERYGLQANPGGRHAAGGTANYIVPLGFQYLELIAVVEPSEIRDSHLGARVMQAVGDGRTFVAWALRTADLDALRAKLLGEGWDLPPIAEGARRRPDGQVLSWRTQDVFIALPARPYDFSRGPLRFGSKPREKAVRCQRLADGRPVRDAHR